MQSPAPRRNGESDRRERLNQTDVLRPLFLTLATVLCGASITCFVGLADAEGRTLATVFLAVGLLLGWLGVRCRNAFFTPDGLLRAGWSGRELVPWSEVETIELDVQPCQYDDIGIVRLRTECGRRITIRMTPERVGPVAKQVREVCPRALVDDARTGQIIAPREGRRNFLGA